MIRLNIPFVLHFQTWHEKQPEGAPFILRDKVRDSLNVGNRFFQLTASEGSFFLLETNRIRFQLGSTGLGWPA